ncbi:MAG: hypothetical protein HY939_01200 [Gammaproteobacteria bacterium]|nr:hypothetical protein [Gammaproteobacteria bacterium]
MLFLRLIWNGIVAAALLFLIFMFGADRTFVLVPLFSAIPMAPSLSDMQLKTVTPKTFYGNKASDFFGLGQHSMLTSPMQKLANADAHAVAWVVKVSMGSEMSASWIAKLQKQHFPAFVYPGDSQLAAHFIFVGPYVHHEDADRVVEMLKNTFGLAGDVVRFDPIVAS